MIGKYINQFMADNELLVNEEFFIKNMDGNRVLIGLADRYKIEDIDGGILTAVVMNEKDKPPAMLLESALIDLLRENYFIEKSLFIQLSENVITSSAQPVGYKKKFLVERRKAFCCANTSAFTKPNKQRLKMFRVV